MGKLEGQPPTVENVRLQLRQLDSLLDQQDPPLLHVVGTAANIAACMHNMLVSATAGDDEMVGDLAREARASIELLSSLYETTESAARRAITLHWMRQAAKGQS